MSYPPPPNDPNASGSANPGGGFGPPPSASPSEPSGGYGYPHPSTAPTMAGGAPPGASGGHAPSPPDGGAGGGNGGKIAALIVGGAVVVGGLIIGGVLLFGGSDDDKKDSADNKPTATQSEQSSQPSPSQPAYVLPPGACYDHPSLSSDVEEMREVPCTGPHDGEVIAHETLRGNLSSDDALREEALKLCAQHANPVLQRLGKGYYYYAIFPPLRDYVNQGHSTVVCSITRTLELDGPNLTEPLP